MMLDAEIEARERAVWQALVDGDALADRTALAEDFLGVYPDGFSGRDGHVAQLASGATVADFTLSDITVRPLGHDHALIAYAARFRRVGRVADERMFVTSIWRRKAGSWVNVFSQDTPAGA